MNEEISYRHQNRFMNKAVSMFNSAVKLDILTWALMEIDSLLQPASSACSRKSDFVLYQQIRYMVQTLGQLPQQLLEDGINTKFWFVKSTSQNKWRLNTIHEYGDTIWTKACLNSLDDVTKVKPVCHLSDEDTKAEIKDRANFVDFLKKMLHPDVNKRITPSQLPQQLVYV